jgi:ribonuclease VapC
LIVVDASALVAIADQETDRMRYLDRLALAERAVISSINVVEAGIILIGRNRFESIDQFDRWLVELGVDVEASTPHAEALATYLTFGRGRHPARLNLADCFAYALAKALDAPLLYKGEDFALTDVRSALD